MKLGSNTKCEGRPSSPHGKLCSKGYTHDSMPPQAPLPCGLQWLLGWNRIHSIGQVIPCGHKFYHHFSSRKLNNWRWPTFIFGQYIICLCAALTPETPLFFKKLFLWCFPIKIFDFNLCCRGSNKLKLLVLFNEWHKNGNVCRHVECCRMAILFIFHALHFWKSTSNITAYVCGMWTYYIHAYVY